MLQPFSQAEIAYRDTLLGKAEGVYLDKLARFYGWPRPVVFTRAAWRAGLKQIAIAPRGTPGVAHAAAEAIFADQEIAWTVDLDPAFPQRVTRASGPAAFDKSHVGRLVRLYSPLDGTSGQLYFVEGPALIGGGTSAFANLCPVSTAHWKGADFSRLFATASGVQMQMHAWLTLDSREPALWELLVDQELWKAPPTYFYSLGTTVHTGAPRPFGGHLQDDAFSAGSQVDGPYPPYLSGGSAAGLAGLFDVLLAAGVRASGRQIDFEDADAEG